MKVLLLTTNFPPELLAGTEMVVVALAKALQAAGVDVVVLTTSEIVHYGPDVQAYEYEGIPVLRVFKKLDEWDQNGLYRPRLLQLVGGILAQQRPDLVHAHSLAGWGGRQLMQARALGIPTVFTLHDVWVTCPRYFRLPPEGVVCPDGDDRAPCVACVNLELNHPRLDEVAAALASRDNEVRAEVAAATVRTAPSRTAARLVQEHLPWNDPIEVIGHGVLRPVEPGRRSAQPAPGERLRIGTFGNLVEPKGVLELVQAVGGLDCELHLWGPFLAASFEQQVRQRAEALAVDLRCHGSYDPAVAHPADQLHLAVFPSKCQETYGLVVDEALAHGTPVVVSDRGALAERAGTGGVVVSTLASLPHVLHELASDRVRLAALRATIPAEMPTIDAAARRYLEIYAAAIAASAV